MLQGCSTPCALALALARGLPDRPACAPRWRTEKTSARSVRTAGRFGHPGSVARERFSREALRVTRVFAWATETSRSSCRAVAGMAATAAPKRVAGNSASDYEARIEDSATEGAHAQPDILLGSS